MNNELFFLTDTLLTKKNEKILKNEKLCIQEFFLTL